MRLDDEGGLAWWAWALYWGSMLIALGVVGWTLSKV